MDYFQNLKEIADQLDRLGLLKQANRIDSYLVSLAQLAPALEAPPEAAQAPTPTPPPTPKAPSKAKDPRKELEKLGGTTFRQFDVLKEFYTKNLKDFHYFGDENIKVLQAALDQMYAIYRVVSRDFTQDYDHGTVEKYEAHLEHLQKEVDRSKLMKLTKAKATIDKFLLYDEFEMMMRKIERNHDEGLSELQPVVRKARSIRDSFANVIQQTSEQIAHSDLIQTQ